MAWRLLVPFFLIVLSDLSAAGSVVDSIPARRVVGDTAFWLTHQQQNLQEIGLPDFRTAPGDFLFRFEAFDNIVQINPSGDSLRGIIYHYAQPIRPKEKWGYQNLPLRYDSTVIDPSLLKSFILPLLQEHPLRTLPPQKEIEGWSQGLDGTTYLVEYADAETYDYRTYWTPTSFDSLPEAISVEAFRTVLWDTLRIDSLQSAFRSQLPGGYYLLGGGPSILVIPASGVGIGYHGNSLLPYGVGVGIYLRRLFGRVVDLSIGGTLVGDFRGRREGMFAARKSLPLELYGYGFQSIGYRFRYREGRFAENVPNVVRSHRWSGLLRFAQFPITMTVGTELLTSRQSGWGGFVGLNTSFQIFRKHFFLSGSTTLFAGSKHHHHSIDHTIIRRGKSLLNLEVHFDRFAGQNAVGGSVSFDF